MIKNIMALTKEDLDNIKLPLSDEDYQMLRREDAKSCYKIWQLASPELREAFNKKEAERVDNNRRPKIGRFLSHTTGAIADIGISRIKQFCDIGDDSNDK